MKTGVQQQIKLIWKGWGGSLIIAILIATSFKSAIAELNHVPTGSMKPTIMEGDRIFVNKLAYDLKLPYTRIHLATWHHPERGDIVVFPSPEDGVRLVKRVVGLPGETIAMKNNRLFINGATLAYDALDQKYMDQVASEERPSHLFFAETFDGTTHPVMFTPSHPFVRTFPETPVPDNCYFVMGDNRDNSKDSRFFGFVHRSQILGRSNYVFASLDNGNYYMPRWHRFFSRMP